MTLSHWTGSHGGLPPFDRMRLDDLEPALLAAMDAHLAELDAIARNPAPPSFENTIVAMERAGTRIERVGVCHGVWRSNLSSAAFRALDARLAPARADYRARVAQHDALFARVRRIHADFARRGATLAGEARERFAAIERRLAELYVAFRGRLLADEERYVLLDEDQLGGLPDAVRRSAARAAETRGHAGRYAILNTRSAVEAFLTASTERAAREEVWRAFHRRGEGDEGPDNRDVAAEILRLRAARARLLGYPDHARFVLDDRMAGTPERARALLDEVWPHARARVGEEVAALQAIADRDGVTLAPWDYLHYADRLRREQYALDAAEVRPYLGLDSLVAAIHFVAETVFGLRFAPADGVPVFHPDVRVWEVTRRDGGALVGLWYLDPFARPGKRSGAWATAYRGYADLDGPRLVLAANNANLLPPAPGQPVLVSWDDARVLFHEFGHALHLLLATARYPTLGGIVRDYGELQSQLLERWLPTGPVIRGFLRHHATGEPMPDALVARLARAATFLQGFATAEYLASAYLDLALHLADPDGLDVGAFEQALLAELGLPPQLAPRHRPAHFAHVFADEGYAAGYYGYLWADVLTADAAEAFTDAPGGLYDADVARRVVEHLFAPRDAVDPAEAWQAFRGRDPDIGALLRDRGFLPSG